MHTQTHICKCPCTQTHTQMPMHTILFSPYTYVCTRTHIRAYVCMQIDSSMQVRTYTHTPIYTRAQWSNYGGPGGGGLAPLVVSMALLVQLIFNGLGGAAKRPSYSRKMAPLRSQNGPLKS